MAVVITKRRKAYNVIYTIQNENGDIEKRYETFYNREQALKRKEQIDGGKRNKIIVKAESKIKILKELKAFGISKQTLFPELESQASEIIAQYSN